MLKADRAGPLEGGEKHGEDIRGTQAGWSRVSSRQNSRLSWREPRKRDSEDDTGVTTDKPLVDKSANPLGRTILVLW